MRYFSILECDENRTFRISIKNLPCIIPFFYLRSEVESPSDIGGEIFGSADGVGAIDQGGNSLPFEIESGDLSIL